MSSDLELEVSAGPERSGYQVRVVRSAAGGEPVSNLRLDVENLLARRDGLEATLLASSVAARRTVPVNEQPVQEVGRQLFKALFSGPVYGAYRASLGVAEERHNRLRVVLRLTAPELAALPWEMLFDPETDTYLCRQEPLVRHVPAPYTPEPLQVHPPLRILGLVAAPRGLPALDVATEQQHLRQALAEPAAGGLVQLQWVPQATWPDVQHQLLTGGEWHVLHFIGHGDYDTRTNEGVLAFVDAEGRADLVEANRLADLLGEAQPTPRLVVLNSCSSGETGAGDLFSGTAAALVHSGISAIAAMQFTVSDTAATAFARGFYTALASGRTVDEAMRSGRISILGTPRTLEWLTPVLYLRGDATRLFDLAAPAVPSPQRAADQDTAVPKRRRAELRAMYVEARAEFRLMHYGTAVGLLDDLLTLDPTYPDAADLRTTAQRQQQLAENYQRASEAEQAGDWLSATAAYGDVLAIDPTYRDAATRKQDCEQRQHIADLQAELGIHFNAEHWPAVIKVSDEIHQLDPTAADPQGQATTARRNLFDKAQAELELEHYETAVGLLNDLLTLAPDYPAAQELRATAERQWQLFERYRRATETAQAGDWLGAASAYGQVLDLDPTYRDAATRKQACENQQHIADLHTQLRTHAQAGRWPSVVEVSNKICQLNPAAADPDGLATTARDHLTQQKQAEERPRREQQISRWQQQLRARAAADAWEDVLAWSDRLAEIDPTAADPDGLATSARERSASGSETVAGAAAGRSSAPPPPESHPEDSGEKATTEPLSQANRAYRPLQAVSGSPSKPATEAAPAKRNKSRVILVAVGSLLILILVIVGIAVSIAVSNSRNSPIARDSDPAALAQLKSHLSADLQSCGTSNMADWEWSKGVRAVTGTCSDGLQYTQYDSDAHARSAVQYPTKGSCAVAPVEEGLNITETWSDGSRSGLMECYPSGIYSNGGRTYVRTYVIDWYINGLAITGHYFSDPKEDYSAALHKAVTARDQVR